MSYYIDYLSLIKLPRTRTNLQYCHLTTSIPSSRAHRETSLTEQGPALAVFTRTFL